jgi:signal transduction histidine kinase
MFPYYITSLLTTVASLGLGFFVFYKNPKNHLHQSLLRLNLVVAAWSLFLFLHYISKTLSIATFTLYILHTAAIFIPVCYLHFVSDLLNTNKQKIIRASYIISIVFAVLIYNNNFIAGIEPKLYFRFYATAGKLYLLWIIAYLITAGYTTYLLLKNYSGSSRIKKIRIRYVLLASFIGFVGGSTIYPLFYNIEIPPWGEHIIFIYPVIFSIAVLKHDVLELNIVIKRTIVYSVSILLITITYLVIVLLSERLLRNVMGYQSIWVTVAAAVIIALIFTPLKNMVESLIEKFYIRNAYQRLQRELIDSDRSKALAQLAAGMAHEIRNPLTAIKTFSEYLPKKFDDKDFRNDFSQIVKSEVDKINSLITQLLEFSKPTSPVLVPTDPHQLLDYTLDILSAEILKNNIKIVKNYTADTSLIEVDSNKLKHVLFNIIRNAIEAMRYSGTLSINTLNRKDNFMIEVADTGCGIKKNDLKKIFQPFFSTKPKGTGLGLAVTESIIAEHNGNISAKSAFGKGTTFTISLPKNS